MAPHHAAPAAAHAVHEDPQRLVLASRPHLLPIAARHRLCRLVSPLQGKGTIVSLARDHVIPSGAVAAKTPATCTARDADHLLDDNYLFGQNMTEHNPAVSPPVTRF
eukprot:scaffold47240_cov63-Phaeocystis_antarctica.AAC.8